MNNTKLVNELLAQKKRIVFFGGAGVSCESGIPDFRSTTGLYNKKYNFEPEEILSHHFFCNNPDYFYDFYKKNMIYLDAQPNSAHNKLFLLEQNKDIIIITQNIDGLHQKAGSTNVIELHGSVYRNYCMKCGKQYNINYVMESKGTPRCVDCMGIVRPDVVLYEEALSEDVIKKAINAISNAELLIIGGTSLTVYPAAGLINYYHGENIVIINKNSNYNHINNKKIIEINEPIAEFFRKIN